MTHPKFAHSFEVVADFPKRLEPLRKLASNYLWTWRHDFRDLFRSADKALWDASGHNPVKMLNSITPDRAEKLASDDLFLARMDLCARELDDYLGSETWFSKTFPDHSGKTVVAYFCAEFGISEGLPIYSGGLGVLAGDHLKAASDLGIPLVGVGLLYNRGYFRQRLNHDGWQQEFYPQYDYFNFPLTLMRGENDQPIRVEVEFPDRVVTCQIWKALVGRVPLYLLDSNVLENEQSDQGITDTLYGGDQEMRIRQEMILGIGGMKALKSVGVQPTVCHINEGHAAFLSVERVRQFMEEHGCDYKVARQAVVAGNSFTTHTPVPAGFDLFNPELLERYMGRSVKSIGVEFDQFLKLGRIEPENRNEAFNMAVLAMSNADHVNGVAKLHAKVTRQMFSARWRDYPEDEVPVIPITNGIHTMTWVSRRMAKLFDEYLGPDWRHRGDDPEIWASVYSIPDDELWAARENERGDLVRFVRRRLQTDLESRNTSKPDFNVVSAVLDPRVLTIGFARRFATYKRATLMLTDRERLRNILFHPERPVQIVIAGKAHPHDDGGKKMIQDLVNNISQEGIQSRIVFLEDYDMEVARRLVQGVDVWLNNPRRPMEASGTSGMKVVPNGGINCSVLDGWWDEAYDPTVGFSIGEANDNIDQGHQDWLDSRSLYGHIEQEIAPKFYHRVDNGLPSSWLTMVKKSMATLAPNFSTFRMVREYTEKFYVPASEAYQAFTKDGQVLAREALDWRARVRAAWPTVRVVKVEDDAKGRTSFGAKFLIKATVKLGPLSPADVSVQAIVGRIGASRELIDTLATELEPTGQEGDTVIYEGTLSCDSPGHRGYTVRIIPKHSLVSVAHELPLVAWEAR